MGMAGRKRKAGVKRHQCGKVVQPSQPRDHGTPELQDRRRALTGNPRACIELECPLDLIQRQLTEDQHRAGHIARQRYRRYRQALETPALTMGGLRDHVDGSRAHVMDQDSARKAEAEWIDMLNAVRKYSARAAGEVMRIAKDLPPRNVSMLCGGLEAFAQHIGLTREIRSEAA